MNKLEISLEEQYIVVEIAKKFSEKKFLSYRNLLRYFRKYGEVSFIEIEMNFHDTRGDVITCMENSHIIFWTHSSHKLIGILNLLLKNRKISLIVSSKARYVNEGEYLKYPLLLRDYDYEKKYWIPILFKARD